MTDRVQVLKRETAALGGDAADESAFPTPIEPQEDIIESSGLYVQDASNRDETVLIDRSGDDMRLVAPGAIQLITDVDLGSASTDTISFVGQVDTSITAVKEVAFVIDVAKTTTVGEFGASTTINGAEGRDADGSGVATRGGFSRYFGGKGGAGDATQAGETGGSAVVAGGDGGDAGAFGTGGNGGSAFLTAGVPGAGATVGNILIATIRGGDIDWGNTTDNTTMTQTGSGTTTFNGDMVLGDGATRTLSFNAQGNTDLVFVENVPVDIYIADGTTAGAGDGGTNQLEIRGGRGGDADGVTAAGIGGRGNYRAGKGGDASDAFPGGKGGLSRMFGATGGAGSDLQAAGDGGNAAIFGGAGGDAGAFGVGGIGGNAAMTTGLGKDGSANGVIQIGTARSGLTVTLGNVTENPDFIFDGTGLVDVANGSIDVPAGTSYKVAGTALTTANRTAPNIDKVYAGPTSDANALHKHGPTTSSVLAPKIYRLI